MKRILPERTFPVAPDASGAGSQKTRFTYILPLLIIFFILHPLTALTKQGQPPFYTLHVISHREMKDAVAELTRFGKSGVDGFYRYEEVKDTGMWYRVYLGKYASSIEAKKAAEEFKQRGLISYALVRKFKPEVEPLAFYTLHVISRREMESAVAELTRFGKSGVDGFYRYEEVKDTGMWYRVYLGKYASSIEAKKAAEEFKQRGLISYALVRRFKPEVEPAPKIARREDFPPYDELKKLEEKQPEPAPKIVRREEAPPSTEVKQLEQMQPEPAQPPEQDQRKEEGPAYAEVKKIEEKQPEQDQRKPEEDVIAPKVAPALKTVHLTLFEAIRYSLEGNHNIRIVSHLPQQAQEELIRAESVYDSSLFLESTHGETYGPWRAEVLDDTLAQKESQLQVGVRKPLTTGGNLSVFQAMDYFDSKSFKVLPSSQYASAPTVELTQPLLKNIGGKAERADISIAGLDLNISHQEFHRTVIDVANRVSQAYWRLFLNRAIVAISQQAYDMAEEVNRREVVRFTEGISKQLDVNRSRAAAEDRRSNVLKAKERVQVEMDQLKFLLNWSDVTIDSEVELIPLETPKTVVEDVDEVEAIVTALENRPEFAKAKYVVDISEIRQELARHEKLPELDALARYSFNSHGSNISDSIDSTQWDDKNSWVVGLEFKWPIGNNAAKARYRKRLSEHKQARSEVQRVIDRIRMEVKQAIYKIKLAKDDIEATRRAKVAGEMVVEGETARFELGQVTNEELLRAQDLLAGARQNNIRAIANYNIALSELARAQGVIGHGLSIEGIKTR